MSKNLKWKLGPSTGSKNQSMGMKPVKQADPALEPDNQPNIFRSRKNLGGTQKKTQVTKTGQLIQSLSSPVKIVTQRNANSSSSSAAATKKVASCAQSQPGKQMRHPHLKIKNLSEIGVRKLELEKTDQKKHETPDQKKQEKELRKKKEQVVVEKLKVPEMEKPKKNAVERVKVQKESMKAGFINNFSLTLTWEEIEEDFLLMTGKRPPRNYKKKNSSIDDVYPGNRLNEVCAAIYKIEGEAAFRKNQRGQ